MTGTSCGGPSTVWPPADRTERTVACHPVLHDALRTSTAAEVAWTDTVEPPPRPGAAAVTELPAGGGPAPGAGEVGPSPGAGVVEHGRTGRSIPVNAQCGAVTPYCMRPSRATAPASAVSACGTPSTAGDAGGDCTTIPPAGVGRAIVTRRARSAPEPVTATSPAGSHRSPPAAVTSPTRNGPDRPGDDRDVQDPHGQHPPEVPAARAARGQGEGVGGRFRRRLVPGGVVRELHGAGRVRSPRTPVVATGVTK